ncbi:hypothetical protein CGL57_10255 [Edwardsiella anguillarum]|nr:hypothetical protein QY76_07960 [Edwardsiella sp. EA181011]RFT03545.1 hypothetical protein CGL57_10255 [Edwardsiella anguillarum]
MLTIRNLPYLLLERIEIVQKIFPVDMLVQIALSIFFLIYKRITIYYAKVTIDTYRCKNGHYILNGLL